MKEKSIFLWMANVSCVFCSGIFPWQTQRWFARLEWLISQLTGIQWDQLLNNRSSFPKLPIKSSKCTMENEKWTNKLDLTSQGMGKEKRGKVQADLALSLEPFAPRGQICIDSPEMVEVYFYSKSFQPVPAFVFVKEIPAVILSRLHSFGPDKLFWCFQSFTECQTVVTSAIQMIAEDHLSVTDLSKLKMKRCLKNQLTLLSLA